MKKYLQIKEDVSLSKSTHVDNESAESQLFLSKKNVDSKKVRNEITKGSYFPLRIGGKMRRFYSKKYPKH